MTITSLSEKFQVEVEANKNEITGIKEQMKDIETNLKVMQNFVGENVVLIDQKVREEVEHQLKSEFEKSVEECIKDRVKIIEARMEIKMKKFEKLMKNTATTSSCNVKSAHRTIQPPIYDGQTPWSSYKKQFEAAAANLWEEEMKATALVIALRSAALEILHTLSEEDR